MPRKLRRKDLAMWNQTMAVMTETQRAQLPGVSDLRARQVLAGGLVAQAAMEVFKVKRLKICPWALREGYSRSPRCTTLTRPSRRHRRRRLGRRR